MDHQTRLQARITIKSILCLLSLLAIAPGMVWAQVNAEPQETDAQVAADQSESTTESASLPKETDSNPEVDETSFDGPPAPSKSYFRGRIQLSEGAESNPSGISAFSSQVSPFTNITGAASLSKYQRHSETAIDYLGGGTVFTGFGRSGPYGQQLQQLIADQRLGWNRLELNFRDFVRYLSEGDIGGSTFGTSNLRFPAGGTGVAQNPVTSDFFGASQSGQVGQEAYLINVTESDITEALTRRSSVRLAGAYSIIDYFGSNQDRFDSRQVTGQASYDYELTPRTSVGVAYGYRTFKFPRSNVGTVVTNSVVFVYEHHVSPRIIVRLDAGPEFTNLSGGTSKTIQEINATAGALLRYQWKKSSMSASYNRLVTAGSGFFAGGNTNVALFSFERTLSRLWQGVLDCGYTRVSGIGFSSAVISRSSYQYGFAGVAVQRRLKRSLIAFATYQFNDQEFGSCGTSRNCSPDIRRHTFAVGLDYYIRPVRLE